MLKKARQRKHGGHPTIIARWYAEESCRSSLAEHNIGEKEIILFDRIALERHDCTATRAERLQNARHWILRLNADGPQKPLRQRPEFADALKQCLDMQDAHLGEMQQSLTPIRPEHRQDKEKVNNSKEEDTSITMSIAKLDGRNTERHGETRKQCLHLQLRRGQFSQLQTSWSSWQPHIICEMVVISVSWKGFQKIDGVCREDTHSQRTSVQYSLFTSAERTPRAWLKNCITSLCA